VTLASAYFRRGDTGHAVRMCRKAIVKAEALDSPVARASAYWNASNFEAERGSVANAVPLAERALALLTEGQDARNIARLRGNLGRMQLELNPPEVPDALRNLEQAGEELVWSSASTTEIADNNCYIARAYYLDGDLDRADVICAQVIETVKGESPLVAAEAEALAGQVAAARGSADEAARAYRRAVFTLTAVGADKEAAQLWFELADLLEEVGEAQAARDAYRSAAAASGLRARPKVSAGVVLA
jgi:tetratricopeptide (TPR) repeat protein